MTLVHVVVPDAYDDPLRPSGGNVYDRRLCEELARQGWTVRVLRVPGTGAGETSALASLLAAVPDGGLVVVDGLVGSDRPDAVVPHTDRLRLVMLVHMPQGVVAGDGQTPARERAVLGRCAAVVATSRWAARWLSDRHALPPGTVWVAEPGVDVADPAAASSSGGRLLCVAAVTPVKGHDVLVEALAAIRDLDWTCTCVGSTAIDPVFADRVATGAGRHGIGDRTRFVGPLTGARLAAAYAAADLLVLPSRFETFGMAITEGLARGLPVIASDVGGVSEALGAKGGVLVRPDDPAPLTAALRRWLTDAVRRDELRRAAWRRRAELTLWSTTAQRVGEVLTRLVAGRR